MHGFFVSGKKPPSPIRLARQLYGFSLMELAAQIGCDPSHLARIERGERAAGPDLAVRLLEVFSGRTKEVEP